MKKKSNCLICLIVFCLISFQYVAADENKEYAVSPREVIKTLKIGEFSDNTITINNNKQSPIKVFFSIEGDVKEIMESDVKELAIAAGSGGNLKLTAFGKNISVYSGFLKISGGIEEALPLNITVSNVGGIPVEAVSIDIEPLEDKVIIGDVLKYKVDVHNLMGRPFELTLSHSIDRIGEQSTYMVDKAFLTENEKVMLNTSVTILKEFKIPDFIRPGDFVINIKASYFGLDSTASRRFSVVEPIMDYLIFGILPIRWLLLVASCVFMGAIAFIVYRSKAAKKKRYAAKIDFNLLPKPGPRSAYMGKIAETNKKAYFDLDQLATHTLVAGSTGGGKTVSTEVLVEEALLKKVAVIVFDPTAQWTGFLRKCQEKKMLNLYKKYDMKKTEARAFNGNIKQITNAREIINLTKFMKSGEINVFSVSKLDPEDIDVLVANTVRQVFHANLPESPELKLLIIFDEVHRLLPKFGGSGEGFVQIERAAREFRKWGVGLILISQVLTDFVGETKANINTEIQMRTRDQGDLDRIKNKYGSYMLQSLLKSSTGTGMIENSAYNRGNPYFVAFRPLLHEHARLTDAELDNYNKYNDIIDDLEFQIEQLEKEGIDIFDLKLELKMALDKVKSGSFNMVNIYLEGLTPRINSQWEKLGKKPKKREIQLVSKEELKKEVEKAKELREKYEKGDAKGSPKKENKEMPPLRLVSGIVVATLSELEDAVDTMDDKTFSQHLKGEKNDFSDWIRNFDDALADKLSHIVTKKDMKIVLEAYHQEKKE